MPRGITPRQPSRSGRQDKVSKTTLRPKARIAKGFPPRKTAAKATARVAGRKAAAKKTAGKAAAAPKGYNPLAPERVNEILKRLDDRYPAATCALHHNSAWELLVATILSAQCTDVRVNMVTPVLFEKYPTPEAFAALKPEELEDDIRSTGFFRNKSKSVVGAARKLISDFGGEVPRTMDELLQLPGVARKTANVVLGTWFRIADGVVVDTHVQRISRRLELTRNDDPREDRAGPDEDHSARQVDRLRTPDHPAWPRSVHCAQAQVRRLPAGEPLPLPLTKPGAQWTFTGDRG